MRYTFLRIDFPSYSYQKQPLSHLPSFSHFGPVWNTFLSALYHSWQPYSLLKQAPLQNDNLGLFSNYTPYKITTTPTPHKQRALTQETESRSTVGTKWEKMCIMSPSLSSLKMLQATVSICIIFDQPFSILFIPFNFFKSKFSWCKQVGHWMANRLFSKQTPLQNHKPGGCKKIKTTPLQNHKPGGGANNHFSHICIFRIPFGKICRVGGY